MIICHEHQAIFFHVPKTGGTSVYKTLLVMGGEKAGLHKKPLTADHDTPAIMRNYSTFSTVRNPYTRIASWFTWLTRETEKGRKKNRVIPPGDFLDFVKSYRYPYTPQKLEVYDIQQPQAQWLRDSHGFLPDLIMHQENLQKDWELACGAILGVDPPPTLPHYKETAHRGLELYCDRSRQIIRDRFSEDFEVFGYSR